MSVQSVSYTPMQWGSSALAALAVHGAVALALLPGSEPAVESGGAPVVLVDFAPLPTAPAMPRTDLMLGVQAPEPPTEEQEKVERQEETRVVDQPVEEPRPVMHAEVTLPKPMIEPWREARSEQVERQATAEIVAASAPPVAIAADRPAGPDAGRIVAASAAMLAGWQRTLAAHIEKFKRYPRQARNAEGIARIAFTIDRRGRVADSRIVASSGSDVLDADALEMVRRAEPFPAPPSEVGDEQLRQVAPIRYVAPRGK